MPRTKRVLQENTSSNIKPCKFPVVGEMIDSYIRAMDAKAKMFQISFETKLNEHPLKIESEFAETFLKFRKYNNMTMNELKTVYPKENTTTMMKSRRTIGRPRKSRSVSVTKNKSQNASSTLKKPTRASRSLSRATAKERNTPVHPPPRTYGMITPKVKPNTPQVLLRRPQQGEMAMSMQGSPLMVDHILPNKKANVNIPLLDGRVYSILPEKGLRTSDIPDLDPQVRRQIQTLRDNLSKVLNDNY